MGRRLFLASMCVLGITAWAQDWKEIKPPPTRQDVSLIYERVASLDDFSQPGRWQGAQHGQSAHALVIPSEGRHPNEKALRVQYEFGGKEGLEYVDVAGNVPIPDNVTAVGLWMRGGAHPLPARIRIVDAKGECFQYDLRNLQPGEWILGIANLDMPAGHWGGDNNGKMDRPCRLASFVFDKLGRGFKAQGEFVIVDFAAYKAKPERLQPHGFKLFVPSQQEFLVYEPNQPIRLAVSLDPAEAKDNKKMPVPISATLLDPFEKILQTQHLALKYGVEATYISLKQAETGAYDLRLRQAGREDDLDAPWADFRFAVLPKPLEQIEASPFGVSTHFGQSWPQAVMPLIARAGIKFIRDEIYWSSVEQEKGHINIGEKFRRYVAEALHLGLEPLIILDYANKFYDGGDFPTSPEARAGFARYAATIARELPRIRYFEIWNEWCGGCGMGHPGKAADYAPLFLAAAQALRNVRRDMTIIGIGGEGDGRAFSEMMAGGAGAAMDGFSIHPYMYPGLPGENFRQHLALAQAQAEAAAGKSLPLWITEIGWPTQLDGRGSSWLHQARCLVRMMLIALAQGARMICWYDFKDDGLNLHYNEHNFGLVHHDEFAWAPKPAYVAYAHLIRMLYKRKLIESESLPTGEWRLKFVGPQDQLVVAWMSDPSQKQQLPVNKKAIVFDMFGRPIRHNGSLMCTWDPVFILMPR